MTPACFGYRVVGWLKGQARTPSYRLRMDQTENGRAQNTRLALARSSLTDTMMIPWAALDMADEAGGFKVIWYRMVVVG